MTTLDHVVVNALHGMDAAAACFEALGFTLTPLGRHTLGSINHLMMTPGPYLELVGVPVGGRQRPEVLDSPFGLNGLVFGSENADATHEWLAAAELDPSPPVSFSRPVAIGGTETEARFRTVRVPEALFPAGRVYFCEHLTPELVWRDEWLTHPNGFSGLDRIEVVSPDPEATAGIYARATNGAAAPFAEGWRVPVGDFAIDIVAGPRPRFSVLGLRFDRLDAIAERAKQLPGIVWSDPEGDAPATLAIAALDLRLECRGTR